MKRVSKKRKEILSKFDLTKSYTLSEACDLVKGISTTKFDASVDICVRLGVDPRKANQMVRGTVALPHGTGKDIKVLVLCTPDKEKEAIEAVIKSQKINGHKKMAVYFVMGIGFLVHVSGFEPETPAM